MNLLLSCRPLLCLSLALLAGCASAPQRYDAKLAESLGADQYGMRSYVLVLLRTGPTPVPEGDKRKQMFRGHLANISRLAEEGIMVLAGPLDGTDELRGLFVLATPDIETAKRHVATDPTIQNGEFVAEYHTFYGSAALMQVNEISKRIALESP